MKGQMTLVGLLVVLITLITYALLYPTFSGILDSAAENITDQNVVTLIKLSPLFLLIMILVSGLWYVIPHREVVYS